MHFCQVLLASTRCKGTSLVHYFNNELCDIYSDIDIVVGFDGKVRDISNFDFIKDRWENKRPDILKKYSQDINPLVDGTSLLLKDKENFINSLFGGYGFWRFSFNHGIVGNIRKQRMGRYCLRTISGTFHYLWM